MTALYGRYLDYVVAALMVLNVIMYITAITSVSYRVVFKVSMSIHPSPPFRVQVVFEQNVFRAWWCFKCGVPCLDFVVCFANCLAVLSQ